MRCPGCNSENPEVTRFCGNCGAPPRNQCVKCGSEDPPRFKFCSECGEPLDSAAAPVRAEAEQRGGPTGERRHLTVLFCDLVGSTGIAAKLDPEEWRETVGGYHRAAAESITRFGGQVAKYLGDGVMAFFGYPEAHENDAERAARAGLAIIDAIAKLNEQPERPKLAARVGIHSGAVVVGAGAGKDADVFGDAPPFREEARVRSLAGFTEVAAFSFSLRSAKRGSEAHIMADTPNQVSISSAELWSTLSGFDAFSTFSDHEREAFQHAFEHEYGMRVRRFPPGGVICRQGEFELDLCIVLSGRAEVHDDDGAGVEQRTVYQAGGVFGELGAMGGRPRSFDVVAAQETLIFYIPRHALKHLEINEKARNILADRYRERAVRTMTAKLELFDTVPESFVDELIPHCRILRYDLRGVPIVQQGEQVDGFYIILDGFVQIVRERADRQRRVLAYLREGEYFGEIALLGDGAAWASAFTAGKCELIKIDKEEFTLLCRRYPATERAMREVMERQKEQENNVTAELSDLLEKSGQLGVIQSDALLVMDMDLCIKCDNCVKACESLHGRSRLIRNGVQIGKYLVPSACRHCDDPKCMSACPTGAVKRRPEGEIYFQYDLCIGCGNCAIACPFDNITMIDTPSFDKAQARKAAVVGGDFFRPYPLAQHDAQGGFLSRLFGGGAQSHPPHGFDRAEEGHGHTPPSFPIKCDLCDGLPFMGCVHSCPTGAAIRIEAAELFESIQAVSAKSHIRKARDGE